MKVLWRYWSVFFWVVVNNKGNSGFFFHFNAGQVILIRQEKAASFGLLGLLADTILAFLVWWDVGEFFDDTEVHLEKLAIVKLFIRNGSVRLRQIIIFLKEPKIKTNTISAYPRATVSKSEAYVSEMEMLKKTQPQLHLNP